MTINDQWWKGDCACQHGIVSTITDDGARLEYCTCDDGIARRYAGVPHNMIGWTLDNFPGLSEHATEIDRWLRQRNQMWLILMGRFGRGKTSLAAGAMTAWIDGGIEHFGETAWIMGHGKDAVFWPAEALADCVKESFNKHANVASPLPHLRDECRLLVMDDVEKIRGSDFEGNLFNQLMARRYEGWTRKRTIITTNLNRKGLSGFFGGWVWSRIEHISKFMVVDGPDLRQAERQELEAVG